MSIEENKSIPHRYYDEVYNQKNLDVIDEIYNKNVISHISSQEIKGTDGIKEFVSKNLNGFPDIHFSIEDQIAKGDMVVTRWTFTGTHKGEFKGIAPTGKSVTATGITMGKIAKGKIIESWISWDSLGMMQQIGAVSLSGQK